MNSKKEADRGFLFLYVPKPRLSVLCLTFLTLAGCASLDSSDYRQTVMVTSDPPGARIYTGDDLAGVTPAYVRVRRGHSPKITLRLPGQPERKVVLQTHFRWGDSFVGFPIDLLTGTAWQLDDPPPQTFPNRGNVHFTDQPHVVAIAPPISPDTEVADAVGPVIEDKLRASSRYSVIPYEKTAPLFAYYGSGQGITDRKNQRYNLIFETQADHFLVAKAEPSGDHYVVTGQLKSNFTGKTTDQFSWDVTPTEGTLQAGFSSHRFFDDYVYFVPNTVFLNFSSFDPDVSINGVNFTGQSTRGNSFGDQLLNYISSFGLAHTDRPRANVKGHWTFDFVPSVNISNKKISFNDYKPLQGVEFDRWYASGGYGIEVGHQSYIGFFYLDIIPCASWTQLQFETDTFSERVSRVSVTTVAEFGYTRFLSSHLIFKIFARSLTEDQTLWQRAIQDATGSDETVDSIDSTFAGIAIGYYIPSSLEGHKEGWKIFEHNR